MFRLTRSGRSAMFLRSLASGFLARLKRPLERWAFAPSGVAVRRARGDLWASSNHDPQFLFPPPRGVKTLVAFLAREGPGGLAPRIYLDWGDGFNESASLELPRARTHLIRFDFDGCAGLKRLRIDPCDEIARFRFRWAAGDQADTLAREIEPPLAALDQNRGEAARAEIRLADYAPASNIRRTPRTSQEHYRYACELAGRELGPPAPPPEVPLISFVSPLYNTPVAYLDDLLASFRRQGPGWAELILSDDGSTSQATARWLDAHADEPGLAILRGGVNRGIAAASNAGAKAARGRWIGFIDHDDALADHAVRVLARAIAEAPQARFFYTDEAIADAHMRVCDFFDKPAFDDVLLSGVNYINHISLYARDLFEAVGGFRKGFEGSQDYDLLLRALARLPREAIRHVPYAAYVWRRDGRSYSVKFLEKATQNARRALAEAYASGDESIKVEPAILPDLHRVRLASPPRKVSVVVTNRDSFRRMRTLTDGLYRRTDYPGFELVVVDDGTTDAGTLDLYERLKAQDHFTLDRAPAAASLAHRLNRGARAATGDAILFLDNDIEVIESGWLAEMVECLAYRHAGVVGARLLYPTGEIHHAGLSVGGGHWHQGRPGDYAGPFGRLAVRSTLSAVTGACMLIERACFEAVGGFDEEAFGAAFHDVDFCLRARAQGYRAIYSPFATLRRHQSASRGQPRFPREQAALIERHGVPTELDPARSPWRDGAVEPARRAIDVMPGSR